MPATLMAFGQLASENEVTAMKATGISLYRMIMPVFVAAVLLTVGLVFYQNYILPESNHRLLNLMIDIGKMKPTLEIKENIFSTAVDGYTILIREKNDKTGEIKDIQIFEERKGGVPTTIIADRGRMFYIDEENLLRFELEDGEIHEMPDAKDISTYRKTLFSNFTINMQDTERDLERSERSYRGDREMSTGMMMEKIEDLQSEIERYRRDMHVSAVRNMTARIAPVMGVDALEIGDGEVVRIPETAREERRRRSAGSPAQQQLYALETIFRRIVGLKSQVFRYKVEIHKKYSIPFSCIIFVLCGAPLAIRSGKKGMTMSIAFSIVFFLVYYVFLISGEKMADRRLLEPWLAMWLPNIVLLSASMALLWSTVREAQTINYDRLNLFNRWKSRKRARIF
jgi:lipopolysaccharide export system permease protein